jgi:hypothetical protein
MATRTNDPGQNSPSYWSIGMRSLSQPGGTSNFHVSGKSTVFPSVNSLFLESRISNWQSLLHIFYKCEHETGPFHFHT